jgi:hypothetical protein
MQFISFLNGMAKETIVSAKWMFLASITLCP